MKSRTLIRHIFIVVVLLFFFMQTIAQDTYSCTATKLNVRKNASSTSDIIGHFYLNQKINVMEIHDGWALVDVDGQRGYVSTEYLSQNQSSINKSANKRGEDILVALFWLFFFFSVFVTPVLVFIRKSKRKIKNFKGDVKSSGFIEAFMSRLEDWSDDVHARYGRH